MADVIPPIVLASGVAFVLPRAATLTGIIGEADNGSSGSLKRNGVVLVAMPGGATNDLCYAITGVAIKLFEGDSLVAYSMNLTLIFG